MSKIHIIKNTASQSIKDFNLLAIDPATNCGWAMSNDLYGCWNLKRGRDESWGMRLIRLKSKLDEINSLNKISMIAYERPAGRHKGSIICHAKIVGAIESFCVENGIEYRAYSASEIKKFATGKGNANKLKMVEAACSKYGYQGKDDNEADALHLLNLAKNDLFK